MFLGLWFGGDGWGALIIDELYGTLLGLSTEALADFISRGVICRCVICT